LQIETPARLALLIEAVLEINPIHPSQDPLNPMEDLGAPDGESEAYAINDAAQVVGAFGVLGISTTAFIWTPAGGLQDLNSLVVNLPAESHLDSATGINKKGQIVGYTSDYRAFLLTPKPVALPFIPLLLD
jgi:probable HAF family extracellular repeat protein